MRRGRIHVVVFESEFGSPEEFLSKVRSELPGYREKNVIFLFPENVLGKKPIERKQAKELAVRMSNILRAHGNANVVYSVLERAGRSGKVLITNSGYLVSPKLAGGGIAYQVYPKVTTYFKGEYLTDGDKAAMVKHSADFKKALELFSKLAGRVKEFPRIKIDGKTVELRVCADAAQGPITDLYPARTSGKKAHLVLVPANNLPLNEFEFMHFSETLASRGRIVVADKERGSAIARRRGNRILFKKLDQKKTVRASRFRITRG
ncbi:MAG: hypothetical protein Q8N60_00300 [Candidatus Diapherotrites archaeon]|nr:hypothetical protein [Candidatus Diapherotrites archaeon]